MTVYYLLHLGKWKIQFYSFVPNPAEWWKPVELTESYWIIPGTDPERAGYFI